jgi:hypothetical protein
MNTVLRERFRIDHTTIQFEHVKCENAAEICSHQPNHALEHQH